MADRRGGAPMRVWVSAKETIQLRPYETAVVELGIEVDHGTPKAEIAQAIRDAEAIYVLLREKVHARVAAARAEAVAGGEDVKPAPGGKAGWEHAPSPPRRGRS